MEKNVQKDWKAFIVTGVYSEARSQKAGRGSQRVENDLKSPKKCNEVGQVGAAEGRGVPE